MVVDAPVKAAHPRRGLSDNVAVAGEAAGGKRLRKTKIEFFFLVAILNDTRYYLNNLLQISHKTQHSEKWRDDFLSTRYRAKKEKRRGKEEKEEKEDDERKGNSGNRLCTAGAGKEGEITSLHSWRPASRRPAP